MEIRLTKNENELDACAQLMSESEPFNTLQLTFEKCKSAVRGDYKDVFLAVEDNVFVGFVVLSYYGVLRGYIQTICIKPDYRNRGIGSKLLKFSEDKLRKEFANIFICVSSFNPKAQALYERLGFEKIGELKDHFIKGKDEYILRKQICSLNEFKPA